MKLLLRLLNRIAGALVNTDADERDESCTGLDDLPGEQRWPVVAKAPEPGEIVAVLMTEQHARAIERRGGFAGLELAPPLLFNADDVPTYVLQTPRIERGSLGETLREGPRR